MWIRKPWDLCALIIGKLMGTPTIVGDNARIKNRWCTRNFAGHSCRKYMFNPGNVKEVIKKVKVIVASKVDNFMREGMVLRSALLNFFKESNNKSLKKLVKVFSYN
jgi:hypothetical protein